MDTNIRSAKFVKSVVQHDHVLDDGKPQVAFIGRSNVGKSSTINALTKTPGLARTSSFPGRTQEVNLFLINNNFYLIDLPGYGFTRTSRKERGQFQKLIFWYLFDSPYKQKKVVVIIDANVGLTDDDQQMLYSLEEAGKDVLVIANKVDKIKKADLAKKLSIIRDRAGIHKVIPFSAQMKMGVGEVVKEILG